MTIKEAILLSLKDYPKGAIAREVYQNILDKGVFKFNSIKMRRIYTVITLVNILRI